MTLKPHKTEMYMVSCGIYCLPLGSCEYYEGHPERLGEISADSFVKHC